MLRACLQQATRPARKIYVGNLPMGSSEGEITHFFNQIMPAAKATTAGMVLHVHSRLHLLHIACVCLKRAVSDGIAS